MGDAMTVTLVANRLYKTVRISVDLRREVFGVLGLVFVCGQNSMFLAWPAGRRQGFGGSIFDLHFQFPDNPSLSTVALINKLPTISLAILYNFIIRALLLLEKGLLW